MIFDGVINTFVRRFSLSKRTARYRIGQPGKKPKFYNKRAMYWLNRICLDGNAEIVVTSTWRIRRSVTELAEILYRSGLDKRICVVGKTDRFGRRDAEIKLWLREHMEVSHFVVLDDDVFDLTEVGTHLVLVDTYNGLDEDNYKEAMEILKKIF